MDLAVKQVEDPNKERCKLELKDLKQDMVALQPTKVSDDSRECPQQMILDAGLFKVKMRDRK